MNNPDGVFDAEANTYTDGTGQTIHCIHSRLECGGRPCVIHAPSDHHMRAFPTHFRSDRYLMERICPHGVGHPDPDDCAWQDEFMPERAASVHGCDGCCDPGGQRYGIRQADFSRCPTPLERYKEKLDRIAEITRGEHTIAAVAGDAEILAVICDGDMPWSTRELACRVGDLEDTERSLLVSMAAVKQALLDEGVPVGLTEYGRIRSLGDRVRRAERGSA